MQNFILTNGVTPNALNGTIRCQSNCSHHTRSNNDVRILFQRGDRSHRQPRREEGPETVVHLSPNESTIPSPIDPVYGVFFLTNAIILYSFFYFKQDVEITTIPPNGERFHKIIFLIGIVLNLFSLKLNLILIYIE